MDHLRGVKSANFAYIASITYKNMLITQYKQILALLTPLTQFIVSRYFSVGASITYKNMLITQYKQTWHF